MLFFRLLSHLPLWILYGFSSAVRLILFGVVGYRKKVVLENLQQAFPEKTHLELRIIQRAFEKAFCDQWVETIKLLSISRSSLNRRFLGNWDLLHQLGKEGRSVYLLMGHQFNWEWAFIATQWNVPQTTAGFYLPVSNKTFDELMQRIRSRGGGLLVSLKNLRSGLVALQGKCFVAGLIADQNPSQPETALWLPFMNREAPFFRGPEALARKADTAVVFAELVRHKRGYYEIILTLQTRHAAQTPPEELMRQYVSHLEDCLRRQPYNYLWSHRRWKHVRQTETA